MYKEKNARREYRKLFKRFELGKLKEDDYVHLYKTYNLPFDSVILLASTFIHKGNFTKAISVYLTLLEHVKDRVKKEELLELLGSTYFKAGLLRRSKDIFLKILKFSPRNRQALTYLLLTYEKLNEYDNAYEVTESLNELRVNITHERIYLDAMKVINNSTNSFDKKCEQLLELHKENKLIERIVVQYLLQFNKTLFWKHIHVFETAHVMDLLWYLAFEDIDFDAVSKNDFLTQLYSAKGYVSNAVQSEIFELNILTVLQKDKANQQADLNFEFICKKCKHVYPIYQNRCPHCNSILSFQIELEITRSYIEKNESLQ